MRDDGAALRMLIRSAALKTPSATVSAAVPSFEQSILLRDNPRLDPTRFHFGFSGLPSSTSALQLHPSLNGVVSLACGRQNQLASLTPDYCRVTIVGTDN